MPEARLSAAMSAIEPLDADALLVLGLVNIRYLSGFTGSDAVLLLTGHEQILLCDSRYTLQATSEAGHFAVAEFKVKLEGIASSISGKGLRRVAFDAEQISVAFFNSLTKALPDVEFIPLNDQLDNIRSVKSPEEIDAVAYAAELASSAFNELVPFIRPGVSEKELALKLEILMKEKGADEKAFDFIVASGPRGALPHGRPTDRLLNSGELVTIDFGARCNGYHSDETVTLAVGKPEIRLQEIYEVVRKAHDLAISAVKPGVECRDLDAVARGHIESCGFGKLFGHGLGHGVGLEIHEMPTISSRSSQIVAEGMIFTIEPGIYIPGLGGVRIEDLVEVTGDGCRLLSKVSKKLMIC
jgi:Xaa-Pro aminopeptidase